MIEVILFVAGILLGAVGCFVWLMFYFAKGFNW